MKKTIIFLIDLYHSILSPILKQLFGVSCRYSVTCSEYAAEMFKEYNWIDASKKSFVRLLHCQPFANHYESI